jgi:hypothetical protein
MEQAAPFAPDSASAESLGAAAGAVQVSEISEFQTVLGGTASVCSKAASSRRPRCHFGLHG